MNDLMSEHGSPVLAREEATPALEALVGRLITGEVRVDSALGPEIWVLDRETGGTIGIWDVYGGTRVPQGLNLNAASLVEMAAVLGFDVDAAGAVLQHRDRDGYIASLEDLLRDGVVDEVTFGRLQSMEADMNQVLTSGSSMAEIILGGHSMGSLLFAMLRPNLLRLLSGWLIVLAVLSAGRWLRGGMPGWHALKSSLKGRRVLAALAVSAVVYAGLLAVPPFVWPLRAVLGGAAGAAVALALTARRRPRPGRPDILREAIIWALAGMALLLLV